MKVHMPEIRERNFKSSEPINVLYSSFTVTSTAAYAAALTLGFKSRSCNV